MSIFYSHGWIGVIAHLSPAVKTVQTRWAGSQFSNHPFDLQCCYFAKWFLVKLATSNFCNQLLDTLLVWCWTLHPLESGILSMYSFQIYLQIFLSQSNPRILTWCSALTLRTLDQCRSHMWNICCWTVTIRRPTMKLLSDLYFFWNSMKQQWYWYRDNSIWLYLFSCKQCPCAGASHDVNYKLRIHPALKKDIPC